MRDVEPPTEGRAPGPSLPAPFTAQELAYPAIMAGICAGVLSGVPLINICCCLWMAGGGMLAVYFFYLKAGQPLTNIRDGTRLGMLTGFFGFLVALFVNIFSQLMIHRGIHGVISRYREQIEKSPMASDPQSRDLLAWALTPTGMVGLFLTGMLIFLIAFLMLSAVGGALGVRLMRRPRVPREGQ